MLCGFPYKLLVLLISWIAKSQSISTITLISGTASMSFKGLWQGSVLLLKAKTLSDMHLE